MKRRGFLGLLGIGATAGAASAAGKLTRIAEPVPLVPSAPTIVEKTIVRPANPFSLSQQVAEMRRLQREGKLDALAMANFGWTNYSSTAEQKQISEEFAQLHENMREMKELPGREDWQKNHRHVRFVDLQRQDKRIRRDGLKS